jgi:F-type H+-transporting ATPase subunit gamma
MANARLIRKRIKSVRNTKKITRTMELVATAKSKRAQNRMLGARPYGAAVRDLLAAIRAQGEGAGITHPLLRVPEAVRQVALLVVTANRGLCGGYNTNVLRLGRGRYEEERTAGREVRLSVVGKKGKTFFGFLGVPMAASYVDIGDQPTFAQADRLIAPHLEAFANGTLDALEVAYNHFESAGRQYAKIERLLPLQTGEPKGDSTRNAAARDYLWDPDPAQILRELLPASLKTEMLRILMEAATCEQIARRIAMKNATDNADEFIGNLTRDYNRARQTQITQQIAEIVGGAEALV